MKLKLSGKKVKGLSKIRGLMFKIKKEALVFEFKKDVRCSLHSLFVFYPFKVIWLDKDDNFVEEQVVKPFRMFVRPRKPFRKFIEIPL